MQNPFADDISPPDISQTPTLDEVDQFTAMLKTAEKSNNETIDIVVKLHISNPNDEVGTLAALLHFALESEPQRIAFMWAAAIYQLGDMKAHAHG